MTYAWPFLWMALGAGLLLVFDIVAGSWILRREAKAARRSSDGRLRLILLSDDKPASFKRK